MSGAPLMAGTAAAAAAFAAWAVRGKSSPFFGPFVWRGSGSKRAIALTFDDGPSESTPAVLNLLSRHGARATFFQVGANVRRLPGIAREVAAQGHEIGNHTETHARLWLRSQGFQRRELSLAQGAIHEATGRAPRLFRPPYGVRWPGLSGVLAELGLVGVMWTRIARDWKAGAGEVARRLGEGARNGAILCLHDGRECLVNPDVASTIGALGEVLPRLRLEGYQLVTVSEMLASEPDPASPSTP
ncbi:MAG: polysaccharide deacetylase family protein [Bryobacteraceae bacterium]|nr:polysaccharide deacetylase family protein [Bryobacteraceae bacterium]